MINIKGHAASATTQHHKMRSHVLDVLNCDAREPKCTWENGGGNQRIYKKQKSADLSVQKTVLHIAHHTPQGLLHQEEQRRRAKIQVLL
jgi:hypothetical protein